MEEEFSEFISLLKKEHSQPSMLEFVFCLAFQLSSSDNLQLLRVVGENIPLGSAGGQVFLEQAPSWYLYSVQCCTVKL